MIDVALSIMALLAGGLIMELFAAASPTSPKTSAAELEVLPGAYCEEAGNPS